MFIAVKTNREVKDHARRLVQLAYRIKPPILGGTPLADLERIATGPSPASGDRGVYLIMRRDLTRGRLGEGVIHQRIKDHIGFAIARSQPTPPVNDRGGPVYWSGDLDFANEIIANDYALPYVVLADGISKGTAEDGQERVFDHFGIGADSFLMNKVRR
jgi:hypothetical protein